MMLVALGRGGIDEATGIELMLPLPLGTQRLLLDKKLLDEVVPCIIHLIVFQRENAAVEVKKKKRKT